MLRRFAIALLLVACGGPLCAATLERLSLDDMIEKSTAIVRGRVLGSWAAPTGNTVYTHYRVGVVERWKGTPQAEVEFVVLGGTYRGIRQVCNGAPQLAEGQEYVLFLWTSQVSGMTHIIGFTQGVFSMAKGSETVVRAASSELMFEQGTGRVVKDERIEMKLNDLGTRIKARLNGAKGAKQ